MQRIWNSNRKDSETVHCLGNGQLLIYEAGPNLMQVQGPPYTMPSFGSLSFSKENPNEITCESTRLPGTNIWKHKLQVDSANEKISEFTDYMLPDQNVFFRDFVVSEPLMLQFTSAYPTKTHFFKSFSFETVSKDCLMIRMPMGTNFFSNQAVEQETWMLLTADGGQITEDGQILLSGEGRLVLTAGVLPKAISQMAEALAMTSEEAQIQVTDYWKQFLSGITDIGAMLPEHLCSKELKKRTS